MRSSTAAIILAGGRSSRMGADKALLEIEGETMLARTVRVASGVVSDVVIVGRTALPPDLAGTPAIPDAHGDAGPLGGIATGLSHLHAERALVLACDLPYVQADLLELLVTLAPGYDAVVPRLWDMQSMEGAAGGTPSTTRARGGDADVEQGLERDRQVDRSATRVRVHPTCAVYAQSCLPVMVSRLSEGRYRMREVLETLHVRWVEEDEIRRVDPEGCSLLNANTPDGWRELMRGEHAPSPGR